MRDIDEECAKVKRKKPEFRLDVAVEFLWAYYPKGMRTVLNWQLPDGKWCGEGVDIDDKAELRAFLKRHADANLYFTVNEAQTKRDGKPVVKVSKADIKSVLYAHLDLDPPENLAPLVMSNPAFAKWKRETEDMLCALEPAPIVLDSGGGFQALWPVVPGVTADQIEELNHRIALHFTGEGKTHNVDRVLRIPGTINWPNAKKRKAGREPRAATWVREIEGRDAEYETDEIADGLGLPGLDALLQGTTQKQPRSEKRKAKSRSDKANDTEGDRGDSKAMRDYRNGADIEIEDTITSPERHGLGGKLPPALKTRIFSFPSPNEDRSAVAFEIACGLLRRGQSPGKVAAVLLSPCAKGAFGHIDDQPDPERAARRTVGAARVAVEKDAEERAGRTNNPNEIAERIYERTPHLRFQLDWFRWRGRYWERINDEAQVLKTVDDAIHEHGLNPPSRNSRREVMEALALVEEPREMSGEPGKIPMANGILDVKTRKLEPFRRDFYCDWNLQFDYDPDAQRPVAFTRFMRSVWGRDSEEQEALLRWFAYLISGDMSEQKLTWWKGPPRSGKGTLFRLVKQMFGPDAVAAPSLGDLGETFGLEDLIGKSCGMIPEGDIDRRRDAPKSIVRVLKQITGNDEISVKRKHKKPWTGRLPTRLMIAANHFLDLPDLDGAIQARLIAFEMTESFVGREDHDLDDKLKAELPAIFNLVLDRIGKQLIQPERGRALLDQQRRAGNPLADFIDDVLVKTDDPKDFVVRSDIAIWYDEWCANNGARRDQIGRNTMLKELERTVGVKYVQHRVHGPILRGYAAVEIVSDDKVSGGTVVQFPRERA